MCYFFLTYIAASPHVPFLFPHISGSGILTQMPDGARQETSKTDWLGPKENQLKAANHSSGSASSCYTGTLHEHWLPWFNTGIQPLFSVANVAYSSVWLRITDQSTQLRLHNHLQSPFSFSACPLSIVSVGEIRPSLSKIAAHPGTLLQPCPNLAFHPTTHPSTVDSKGSNISTTKTLKFPNSFTYNNLNSSPLPKKQISSKIYFQHRALFSQTPKFENKNHHFIDKILSIKKYN